mmetsp:Transcript_3465/g.21739  ORF Transcript_3465/g.21739 Transcript_3465/m.21739 type:complete len:239 (-) Transcript_3465:573-1289(-)
MGICLKESGFKDLFPICLTYVGQDSPFSNLPLPPRHLRKLALHFVQPATVDKIHDQHLARNESFNAMRHGDLLSNAPQIVMYLVHDLGLPLKIELKLDLLVQLVDRGDQIKVYFPLAQEFGQVAQVGQVLEHLALCRRVLHLHCHRATTFTCLVFGIATNGHIQHLSFLQHCKVRIWVQAAQFLCVRAVAFRDTESSVAPAHLIRFLPRERSYSGLVHLCKRCRSQGLFQIDPFEDVF